MVTAEGIEHDLNSEIEGLESLLTLGGVEASVARQCLDYLQALINIIDFAKSEPCVNYYEICEEAGILMEEGKDTSD